MLKKPSISCMLKNVEEKTYAYGCNAEKWTLPEEIHRWIVTTTQKFMDTTNHVHNKLIVTMNNNKIVEKLLYTKTMVRLS